jgi:hypothetical protein
MRPEYVLYATNPQGTVMLSELFYNGKKAYRAFARLKVLSKDGSRTLLLEDGRTESISPGNDLVIKLSCLNLLWTKRQPWRKSLFDVSDEEYCELSKTLDVPVSLLRRVAALEREYHEDVGSVRWSAIKRKYLPRSFF